MSVFHDGSDGFIRSDVLNIQNAAGSTDYVHIDSSGNVGIGTTNTAAGQVTIQGSGSPRQLVITDDGAEKLQIYQIGNDATIEAGSGGSNSTNLIFKTASSGTESEQMRITSGGNVGIGTSPSVALHVKAGSGQIRLHEGSAADNKYGEIEVSNGKLILHSDKANVENSSTMQFHLDNIEYARFIDNGTFLIGTTNGTGDGGGIQLHGNLENGGFINVKKTSSGASGNKFIQFSRDGSEKGSIALDGTNAVQYNTSSDYRLKRDVVDMADAIDRVKTLLPRRFSWISDPDTTVDGFLAHEAQTVVPEAVRGTHNEVDDDGNAVMQGIDQSKLVPLLTGALQEAITKIETLETKVAALEAKQCNCGGCS
jgi:hypothetical protein